MACNHLPIALLILGVAFLIFWNHKEGFRSQSEKTAIASKLTSQAGSRPEFEAMKSIGLDGAEFYEVRQLWNKNKFTRENIEKVL
jgi:hypothetical protein